MSEPEERPPAEPEKIALHADNPETRRKRMVTGGVGIAIIAAAIGGFVGLFGGKNWGLFVALLVAAPLLYVVGSNARRQLWLIGNDLIVQTWSSIRIDLTAVERIDLVVTDVRSTRTIALLVSPRAKGRAVKIDLAAYSGSAGKELGILPLRHLANALMNNTDANGLVFSELLVAQLRAEAKGSSPQGRPLHRLASAAPGGKLAQRYTLEAVAKFVATLD